MSFDKASLITDRTRADVTAALAAREKVQQGDALTPQEELSLARGMFSLDSLQRIESAFSEAEEALHKCGYYGFALVKRVWTHGDVFRAVDFEAWLENLRQLRVAFYTLDTTPDTPNAAYRFEVLNAIEQIMFDILMIAEDIMSNWRICGTFVCGEERE